MFVPTIRVYRIISNVIWFINIGLEKNAKQPSNLLYEVWFKLFWSCLMYVPYQYKCIHHTKVLKIYYETCCIFHTTSDFTQVCIVCIRVRDVRGAKSHNKKQSLKMKCCFTIHKHKWNVTLFLFKIYEIFQIIFFYQN